MGKKSNSLNLERLDSLKDLDTTRKSSDDDSEHSEKEKNTFMYHL